MKYIGILLCMTTLVCLAFQASAVSESPNNISSNITMGSNESNITMGSIGDWISPNMGQVYTRANSDPGLASMLQWLDTPVPNFPWYTTGGSFYSQAYSYTTFSPFTEYYVTSGMPVVGGIVSNPIRFDITQKTPITVYYGAGVGLPYTQYASAVPSKTNDLWIQGATNWTQYVVSPVGTWLQLIAYSPVEGPAGFYEMIQTDTISSKYNTYQFNQGYNTMNFYADQVGRHMLYFVVNNQPSNVVVVDVFAQAPAGKAATSSYPAARQIPVTVLGNAENSGRFSTSGSSSQISDGLTTTTTSNGITTTTSNGQTTVTSNGQATTTSDGNYQTTTSSDGTIQTTTSTN